jgi:hypothetical protein
MAIDKTGKYWTGTDPADIAECLIAFECEGYVINETRICKCSCGSTLSQLAADPNEACARRECQSCGAKNLICDSSEYWNEAKPTQWACSECGHHECNLGVGFSLYDDQVDGRRDVRWISVGSRCSKCGFLGCFVDWKIGYGPSHQLLDQA